MRTYHRFPNLREYFQRDLHTKLISGIQSIDFENLPCNCRKKNNQDTCKYNNMCRHSLIVYKVECKNTGKIYIGNTQQHFKTRMAQHARDVKMKKLQNKNSDSFASHFADQLRNFETFSHKLHRNMLNCSIIWEATPTPT
jgi:GIY-YIG catalytic domain